MLGRDGMELEESGRGWRGWKLAGRVKWRREILGIGPFPPFPFLLPHPASSQLFLPLQPISITFRLFPIAPPSSRLLTTAFASSQPLQLHSVSSQNFRLLPTSPALFSSLSIASSPFCSSFEPFEPIESFPAKSFESNASLDHM